MSNVITLTEALDRYVYNKNESGSSNRGNAPVGNAAKSGTQITVRNPDNSAYAQNAKDRYNETQRPWYKIGAESEQNADNSAHAQKEKDSYVTDNLLYHQWEQQQKGLKADLSAHAQAEKDNDADKNPLFHQWKTEFDRQQKENAEERDELQKQLKELNQNAAYISTTAASDEYEQERKSLLEQLHARDEAEGREARTYDGRERAGAFFGSWGKGTGASYTNAAANIVDLGNEVGASAKAAERELADLEAQLARAQTAYDEAVQQYGEAGATAEKNLLADAQQKLDAKKALYASTADRDRAAYEKTKATAGNMYDVADKLLSQSEEDMARAKVGTSALGSFALDAAKTGLDIGLDTAVSALGVPGLANMAARVYGSEAQQARLQGDDAQTAAAKGLKSALIEVATEKIAGPFEKAYGKTALSSSINKAVDKLNASGLLKWAADTAGEGFEEGMSDVLNTVADHIMGWDSGENTVWGDIAADKDEILYDMLLGAFVGAFGSAGNIVGNKATAAPAEQTAPVQQNTAQPQTENSAVNVIEALLAQGKISNSQAGKVVESPTLADAFYEVTGIALEGTKAQKRAAIKAAAQTEAQTSPVADVQPTGDISTPPAAQNVKQGDSDALNNTLNLNSRETQTAAPTLAQQNTAPTQETEKKPLSMADYVDKNSSIWNNLDYNDTAAQTKAMREAHERMTAEGRVVKIPESTQKKTAESFPDLRGMKKSERTPILKQKMAELKSDIRQFLNGLKGGSFEFEVNGNVLEAKLYDTGIKEVLEKITQDKANMLNHSDLIFDNAEYLYSLPDYDGNPNVYRWNYFYTPVQIGDSTAGVRIALRDMKQTDSGKTESQIYNWGIKKTPALDGGSPEKTSLSTGVSSAGVIDTTSERYAVKKTGFSQADVMSVSDDISSDTSISTASQNVKQNFAAESSTLAQKNTAPMQETGSTIINDNPATHTAEEMKRIEEYKAAVDDNLVNYIETVRNNPGAKIGRYSLKPVSERAANDIKAITGVDVSGSKTSIEPRMIDHIFKDHGEHGKSDHSMRDINDIARVQYVLDNYDKIEDGGRSTAYQTVKPNGRTGQARTVKFSKAVDGTYYVVEAVPDTKAKTVFVVTTYLANKKTGDMQTANAEATRVTSETENAQSPVYETSSRPGTPQSGIAGDVSDISISTDTQNVKQNFAGNGLYYRPKLGKGEGTRTTQTVETINNADMTTDARREQINPYVKNGRFDYIPDTNKAQVERATEKIKKDGWAKTVADFRADVARGKSSADLVALGAVLLNNAGNSEASVTEYMDIYTDYAELLSRTAGALQVGRMAKQLTPAGQLYGMERVVDRLNEEYKATKLYAKYADIKIDNKLKRDFLRAKDEATRNKCIAAIQQNIADQMPTTFNEAFTAFRYTAMLGNFKTQERNVLGNTMSLTSKIAKDKLAAAIEGAGHFFSGGKMEKTRSVWAGGALYKEAYNDFKAHEAEALGESKYTSIARKTAKEIEDKRTIFKINGDWGKTADSNNAKKLARKAADVSMATLEGWRKATNWTMEMGDAVFSRVAYADAMAGWLKAHKINSFSEATESQLDRARAFAIKEAQEATFRDTNAISELAVSLGSGLKTSQNPVARGLGKVTEGIVPFRKTPANVAVRAVEYSPLGTIETAYKVWQAVNGKANAADVINAASKTLTGTGLFLAGIAWKQAGKLRGKEDDEELDRAQKATGAMDYSYITDKGDYVSLSQFAPMAIPLFMGVRFAELTEDGFDPKDVWAIALGTTDPMLEMSMLQGLNDSLDGISDYGSEQGALGQFLTNALESYISQYVPSVVRHIEQATEEYRQSTYTDKNNPYLSTNTQYWLGKQSAGIPGVDYQQEDYIDMWGRKTKQGEAVERVLNSFFNPVYTSKGKREPLDDELERLYKAGKNIDGFPSVYPDSGSFYQDLDGNGKQMTREQFSNYRISRGTLSRSLARDFVDSEEYKYLNDMERAEVLRDLYKFAADTALRNVKKANGIRSEPDTAYLGMSNKDIPEYLATKQVLSDAANGKTTDWSGVDALLANIKSYSPKVQEKLQTSSALNVNKLLYADNLGIDSKTWYNIRENIQADSGVDAAVAVSKYFAGDDEEKLNMLKTANSKTVPNSDTGKTSSIVRRYEAALNYGISFDDWTRLEEAVAAQPSNNKQNIYNAAAQALPDYPSYKIYDLYKKDSSNEKKVTMVDDYWQQLIENAGKAAAEKP